ncbi:MAG TPA: zinc dependent phospholipase C family protein [Terriglobales bacterium]|nr:zinc dependent phospholipase C family protein [Terriglobales bacterium]
MRRALTLLLVFCFLIAARPLRGYSVLSHEEVIDLAWNTDILPALLKRFPTATPAELKRAHSFAYGGSVIQDVGYYPLGNKKFTNILHYVRTGDFVAWMLRDARNVEEYAFALGALSHYAADSFGHPAVNLSVPVEYPRLRARFGDWIPYETDHDAHLRTEFSFDVLEVAKHRYTSLQYHDFIGFDVSEDLLERAFVDTYGISLDQLLHFDDLTLETFRFAVGTVVPEMTQVALATHRPEIEHEYNNRAKQDFLYHLSRADYNQEFGTRYRRPGIFARILGFLIKLLPFGPAKVLGYRNPTPLTEDLYFRSMDHVLQEYHLLVRQVSAGDLRIPNRNLDTGLLTREGEYKLADQTYADLLRRLDRDHFAHLTPAVRSDIQQFFAAGPPENGSLKPSQWKKTEQALTLLRVASAGAPVSLQPPIHPLVGPLPPRPPAPSPRCCE